MPLIAKSLPRTIFKLPQPKYTPLSYLNPYLTPLTQHVKTQYQTRKMATASNIETLKSYTSCDISDALLALSVPNAGFLPDLILSAPGNSPSPLIAPASTVIFASKFNPEANVGLPEGNIPEGKHYVDLSVEGSVVVMQQPKGQKCAVLGGIMGLRMGKRGVRGVVVMGRVRDLEELEGVGIPIWSKGTSTVGTGAEAKPHSIQIPLDIDGTIVKPGDLVFSDAKNGIVVIPLDKVEQVVAMLPKLVEADDRVKEDVENGMTVQEAFKKHRG